MMKNKAQLKIQEMTFMLVAVALLFILVGLFAASIVFTNLNKKANQNAEEKALSVVTSLADSPEFSCSDSRANCIDSDKLITLVDRQNYKNFWPFNSLTIIRSQSFNKSETDLVDCTFANYPDCDKYIVIPRKSKNENIVSSYVALCRKEAISGYVYEKCEVAQVFAGSEVKTIK